MNNDRKTKDIDLFSNNSSEDIKDLSLNLNTNDVKDPLSENKNNYKEKEERKITKDDYLNAPKPEAKKKSIDSSIYSKRSRKGKTSKKRKIWISSIAGLTVALSLGLGLGLGLGLKGSGGVSGSINGPWNENSEEFLKWLDEKINLGNESVKKEIEVKKDLATLWKFDDLLEKSKFINENSALRAQDTARNDAKENIDNQKETYRDQYGNTWNQEWNNFLTDEGYDSENEYSQALEAQSLLSHITQALYTNTNSQTLLVDDNTGYKFSSTIQTSDNKYRVLKNGSTNLAGDIDWEELMHLYLLIERPIAVETVTMTYNWAPGSSNSNNPTLIQWESNENLEDMWWRLKRMSTNGIDFNGDEGVSSFNSGIQSLGNATYGTEQLKNSIVLGLLNHGVNANDKNIITSNPTSTIYGDLFTAIDDAVLANSGVNWAANANAVTTDHFSRINDNDRAEAGRGFSSTLDGTYFSSGTIDDNLLVQQWAMPTDKDGADRVIATWGSDGLHLSKHAFTLPNEDFTDPDNHTNGLIEWDEANSKYSSVSGRNAVTNGVPVIGERMLVDELNKMVDDEYNDGSIDTGLMSSFNSWLDTNLKSLFLNEALSDTEFINQYFDNGTQGEDYKDLINVSYNSGYQKNKGLYINTLDAIENFVINNNEVFKEADDWNAVGDLLERNLTYFNFNYGPSLNFGVKTIEQLLSSGDLN